MILGLTLGSSRHVDPECAQPDPDAYFIAIAILMMLGYVTVGAFVASRMPRNPLGWLLMTTGVAFLLAAASDEYATYALFTSPGALPFGQVAVWLNNWIFIAAVGPGRVVPRTVPDRHRPVAAVAMAAAGAPRPVRRRDRGSMLRAGRVDITEGVDPSNPTGIEAITPILEPVLWIVGIASVALSILAVVSLVLRYRNARGEERQQIRWIVFVGLAALVLFIATLATTIGLEEGEVSTLNDVLFFAFFIMFGIGIPVAAGIAVMRYRLWELDVILKKTIVATVLVILLTIVALVVLIAVGGIVVGPLSESPGIALLAGIGVGALTWPLLRLSRRIADRFVYGTPSHPVRDAHAVLRPDGRVVRDGRRAPSDGVDPRARARAPGASRSGCSWAASSDPPRPGPRPRVVAPTEPPTEPVPSASLAELTGDVFVVRHQGEQLGAITATMHANDPMDPTKEKLIRELAGQAGLVLRNVRLIEELRASRRRLVAAQDDRAPPRSNATSTTARSSSSSRSR